MSLSLMDKLTKALAFLVASRDGDIAKLLATRGYTPAIRKEGWRLLATAGGADDPAAPKLSQPAGLKLSHLAG